MKKLKLNKAGFAHHIIVLLLVVVSISGFGAYRIIKANAANYDSHVTIRVSGNGGNTVYFKTVTHTLGLCNPHFETISTSSSKTCDGSTMGYPEALNVYVSSVPAGYRLAGWTVTSNNTNGSVSCITTNCRISFDYGSATVTANFVSSDPATVYQATDSYVTLRTAGNDGHSVSFATSHHSLGSCNPQMQQIVVSSSKLCQGVSMGYPSYLNLAVAKAPSGYTFKSWTISAESIQHGSKVSCTTYCRINFDQGKVTLTANFAKTPAPTSSNKWEWPLHTTHSIGSHWGDHNSKGIHKGIDIGKYGGSTLHDTVYAAHDGTVVKSYNGGSCGWFILIKATGTPYWYAYQHLDPNSKYIYVDAKSGGKKTSVHVGDKIARVGAAGGSTCGSPGFYHLHFSVEKHASISFYASPLSNSINPLSVLP